MGFPAKPLPRSSIKTKIAVVMIAGALLTQLLSVAVLVWLNQTAGRHATANRAQVVAHMVADSALAALTFDDDATVREVLEPFGNDSAVDAIMVYDHAGRLVAKHVAHGEAAPNLAQLSGSRPERFTSDGRYYLQRPIMDGASPVGRVLVVANTNEARRSSRRVMLVSVLLIVCALVATVLISVLVQRRISNPIIDLAAELRDVTRAGDYGKRVTWTSSDEIADLYAAVNDLLEYAHRSQRDLQASHATLEARVRERTEELSHAIASLRKEVEQRRRAEEDLRRAQRDLVHAARKAGMAEIATGVLHNIGNVLNSINVSTGLLVEQATRSPTATVEKAAELLKANEDNLAEFLTQDERGRHFPAYFHGLAKQICRERETLLEELQRLEEKVAHVKQIVATQQTFAKSGGLMERVAPRELMQVARTMGQDGLERHGIHVEEEFADVPQIITDRNKVIQILVNLINNAKDAMRGLDAHHRRLVLDIVREGNEVLFGVHDSGEGIDQEHVTVIFQHGFTTKPDGHGFGLHSAALAASELGGSLTVQSDGPGRGATFVLRLPIERDTKASAGAAPVLLTSSGDSEVAATSRS